MGKKRREVPKLDVEMMRQVVEELEKTLQFDKGNGLSSGSSPIPDYENEKWEGDR